jgi:hypothetical protein
MANHDYYRLNQGVYPTIKPGSNWYDNLRVMKTYDNTILKSGFWRCVTKTDGDATADLGTAAGGQQVHAGMDINAAVTNWARFTTPDDAVPVTLTNGFLFWENLGNIITSGQIDLLVEIVVPHPVVQTIVDNV